MWFVSLFIRLVSVELFLNLSFQSTYLFLFWLKIQPIDMVKVRIQLLSGANPGKAYGPMDVAKNMLKESGFGSFYRG